MDMFIDGEVHVELSKRNLDDLAQQYEKHEGAQLVRFTEKGPLRVTVKNDADHYGERAPGPGGFGT